MNFSQKNLTLLWPHFNFENQSGGARWKKIVQISRQGLKQLFHSCIGQNLKTYEVELYFAREYRASRPTPSHEKRMHERF